MLSRISVNQVMKHLFVTVSHARKKIVRIVGSKAGDATVCITGPATYQEQSARTPCSNALGRLLRLPAELLREETQRSSQFGKGCVHLAIGLRVGRQVPRRERIGIDEEDAVLDAPPI